jgi:hypothetical protein
VLEQIIEAGGPVQQVCFAGPSCIGLSCGIAGRGHFRFFLIQKTQFLRQRARAEKSKMVKNRICCHRIVELAADCQRWWGAAIIMKDARTLLLHTLKVR